MIIHDYLFKTNFSVEKFLLSIHMVTGLSGGSWMADECFIVVVYLSQSVVKIEGGQVLRSSFHCGQYKS